MSKKKKQDEIRSKLNRKGIVLVSVLAVIILMVNVITLSYSWFEPQTVTGKGLSYENTSKLRSEECDFETFTGTVVTETTAGYYLGQVKYEETKSTGSISVPAKNGDVNGRVYFRTDITNASESYSSVVSLYIQSMPANLKVACTSPSNTVRTVGSSAVSDYYIVRNAFVKIKDAADAEGPGLLRVEWFVENPTSSAVSIDLDGLYLMYN